MSKINQAEATYPCKKCNGRMSLKSYKEAEMSDTAKYFYRCRCGQALIVKEIWVPKK